MPDTPAPALPLPTEVVPESALPLGARLANAVLRHARTLRFLFDSRGLVIEGSQEACQAFSIAQAEIECLACAYTEHEPAARKELVERIRARDVERIEALEALIAAAREMRALQSSWLKHRDNGVLIQARNAERRFDDQLVVYGWKHSTPPSEAPQHFINDRQSQTQTGD
jgi:hypothetical protein